MSEETGGKKRKDMEPMNKNPDSRTQSKCSLLLHMLLLLK